MRVAATKIHPENPPQNPPLKNGHPGSPSPRPLRAIAPRDPPRDSPREPSARLARVTSRATSPRDPSARPLFIWSGPVWCGLVWAGWQSGLGWSCPVRAGLHPSFQALATRTSLTVSGWSSVRLREIWVNRLRAGAGQTNASGHRIVVIIEGDLSRDGSLPLKNLMGAIINASMLGRLTAYRTWDHRETACLISALIDEMANWGGGPPTSTGLILSKLKREGDEQCCQIRMLCCIPSVSEAVAVALLEHFGGLRQLQQALSENAAFPRVSLGRTSIGKARVKTLRKYVCAA